MPEEKPHNDFKTPHGSIQERVEVVLHDLHATSGGPELLETTVVLQRRNRDHDECPFRHRNEHTVGEVPGRVLQLYRRVVES